MSIITMIVSPYSPLRLSDDRCFDIAHEQIYNRWQNGLTLSIIETTVQIYQINNTVPEIITTQYHVVVRR